MVNIVDIIILVNFILSENEYDYNFDLNSDEMINIVDIIILVNMILED